MTDPAPSVQPVRAWVMCDNNGWFNKLDILSDEENRDDARKWFDRQFPHKAPHRVIRVEIRKVDDE